MNKQPSSYSFDVSHEFLSTEIVWARLQESKFKCNSKSLILR